MKIVRFILLMAVTLLIVLVGLPNIEQGREEARSAQAFMSAQDIRAGALPADTVDPWGNQFDVQHTSSGVTVVSSSGSNMATPADGYDSDDISTSMSNPPHRRSLHRRQIQLLATLGLAASPWLVSLTVMIRRRMTRPWAPDTESTTRA